MPLLAGTCSDTLINFDLLVSTEVEQVGKLPPIIYCLCILWDEAEIGSSTHVVEDDISNTQGYNFHLGTRERLVPR